MPVPKPDLKMVRTFHTLRYKKRLSFRLISEVMRDKRSGKPRDLKTLYRWDNYIKTGSVGKLSTGTPRTALASVGK